MNIDIISVIDALNQEYGSRKISGWMYLIGAIVSILGAISAKELVRKNKALKQSIGENLKTKILRATIFSQEENLTVEYLGQIMQDADGYRLTIESRNNGNTTIVADILKPSLDEVSEYLLSETKFILADFKP